LKAYALLIQIVSKVGWDELLRYRSNAFVMEEEYRVQRAVAEEREKNRVQEVRMNADSGKDEEENVDNQVDEWDAGDEGGESAEEQVSQEKDEKKDVASIDAAKEEKDKDESANKSTGQTVKLEEVNLDGPSIREDHENSGGNIVNGGPKAGVSIDELLRKANNGESTEKKEPVKDQLSPLKQVTTNESKGSTAEKEKVNKKKEMINMIIFKHLQKKQRV